MAVMEWVVKAGAALGLGLLGFVLLPVLAGAVTGFLAALFDIAGVGVPTVLTMEFGTRFTPILAVFGLVAGGYLGVTRT